MIDKQTIFEIHRLHHLGCSHRKIARSLGIDRDTVKSYVNDPERKFSRTATQNLKLDPFRQLIKKWLEEDKEVKAPVVLQRLYENGFDGKITIVGDYLCQLRGPQKKREAFLRFESLPGLAILFLCQSVLTSADDNPFDRRAFFGSFYSSSPVS